MSVLGLQTAQIAKNYLAMDEKMQIYVNLKLTFQNDNPPLWTRIYITERSASIARAKLKKCGFDMDRQELSEIEGNEDLLKGNEVLVDVTENGKYLNATIPADRPKVNKAAISQASDWLRKAKKSEDADELGVPPNVSHLTKEQREELQAKAEQEDIPF